MFISYRRNNFSKTRFPNQAIYFLWSEVTGSSASGCPEAVLPITKSTNHINQPLSIFPFSSIEAPPLSLRSKRSALVATLQVMPRQSRVRAFIRCARPKGALPPWTPRVRHVAGVQGARRFALRYLPPLPKRGSFRWRQGQAASRSLREP
jgi:hypothetical protein